MDFASDKSPCAQALTSTAPPRQPGRDKARRWHCPQCRQAFKKKEHLVRHTQSHTKQKPFVCKHCPKAYSRRCTDNLWLDDQFDLEAMGSAILSANHLPGLSNEPFFSVALSSAENTAGDALIATSRSIKRQMEVHKAVHSRWYTRPIPEPDIPQPLFSFMNQEEVDEEYRAGLSTRLAPNPQDIALPSAEFLNLCVKLYFSKFQPLFPIIHSATFRPTSDKALVLLSICSIGALFVGSDGAARCAKAIFTKLNKAILASWERYIHKGGCEALAVAQAATIGQTYGILSGQPNNLLLTDSFHGTIIAWARQAGLFRVRTAFESTDTINMTDVEGSWRRWAQREETLRLILALQIHDSEFTKIFHHEGLLGHDQNRLPTCCSAELFSATTASNWHAAVISMTQRACNGEDPVLMCSPSQPVCKSSFYAYAQLAGHYAHLSEARCRGALEDHAATIRQRLTLWYDEIVGGIVDKDHDQFSLVGLWHQAFMALYVDFDFLERIVGRDRTPPTSLEEDEVSRWVRSNDGIRCAVHAALIIKRYSMQAISEESAIHVPLSLFHAGIVVYCHIKFGGLAIQRNVDILELKGDEPLSTDITEQIGPTTLYTVTDILRRHGHWDLSRRLASILSILIEGVTDTEMHNLFNRACGRILPHDVNGADNDILNQLRPIIDRAISAQATVYIYGSEFNDGKVIHNVHMKQGNSGRWLKDNSAFQDGGLIFQFEDHREAVFIGFASQARSDDGKETVDIEESPVFIVQALVNPPGTDQQPGTALETIFLKNRTGGEMDLSGWKIRIKTGDTQTLPSGTRIGAAETKTIETSIPLSSNGGFITLLNGRDSRYMVLATQGLKQTAL
ncbi:zinc finger rsv1 [Fusarium tjaetaba]|uniref:Zinc finger rsv1 n=1 Tax=Fusarium tjaetaba TaxID=1567544 RepID=A0A8H5RR82_9HYPO|nr:zinc finger rsv1 [Fusarium tjaetaba]KAF5637613.1 zinc finger rsv1 [Fusarium tjaetaba]